MASSSTKRIIKNSIMMYAVMFLTIVVGIYTSRVVIMTLGVEDFGIYSLIGGLVILFIFINGSMSGSVQRYLSAALGKNNIGETTEFFNAAIVIHIAIALIVLVVGKVVGEWVLLTQLTIPPQRYDAAYWVFQAVLISFTLQVISTPAQAMLVSYEYMSSVAWITFLAPAGRLVSIIIAANTSNYDQLVVFAAMMTIFSLLQLVMYYYCAGLKCGASKLMFVKDKHKYKELSSFAGWGMFGDLASVAKSQGTAILLNIFFGTVANASYGVSGQLVSNFNNLSTMVTRAANPQIIKSYCSGDKENAYKLVTQLSKISFSILFVFSIPFLFETNWILNLWLHDVPQYAASFVRLAIVVALIEISSIPLMTLSRATGVIKLYQAVVGGILLLSVPLSYLALKIYGEAEAVFYVFIVIAIVALFARLTIINRTSGLPLFPFLKATFLKAGIVFFAVIIIAVLPNGVLVDGSNAMRIYHIFVVPLITVVITFKFMLSKSERRTLLGMLRRSNG